MVESWCPATLSCRCYLIDLMKNVVGANLFSSKRVLIFLLCDKTHYHHRTVRSSKSSSVVCPSAILQLLLPDAWRGSLIYSTGSYKMFIGSRITLLYSLLLLPSPSFPNLCSHSGVNLPQLLCIDHKFPFSKA